MCQSWPRTRSLSVARGRAVAGAADPTTDRNQQRGTRQRGPSRFPSRQRGSDNRGDDYAATSRRLARAPTRARVSGTRVQRLNCARLERWAAGPRSAAWRIVCKNTQAARVIRRVTATNDSESATTWTGRATDLQGDASGTHRALTCQLCDSGLLPPVLGSSWRRVWPWFVPSALPAIHGIAPLSSFRGVSARVRQPHSWDRSSGGEFPSAWVEICRAVGVAATPAS